MKNQHRKRLSTALIASGLLVLLAVGIYEASSYPWHLLFARFGWVEEVQELPDPPALPQELVVTPSPTATVDAPPEGEGGEPLEPDALPEVPPVVISRPRVDLTLVGYIKIPKLKVSENLIEGVNNEMYYGIGHYPGTAMPGEKGNCVVAGHRNHVLAHALRHLDKIDVGDTVEITYDGSVFVYEVVQTLVVNPDEVWVMGSKVLEGKTHVLTIITCTPPRNPTQRLIVHAALVGAPEAETPAVEEIPAVEVPVEEETPTAEVPLEETPPEESPAAEPVLAEVSGVEVPTETPAAESPAPTAQ
jgi:LPXTG-site transpeptidase (sortase) family protein